MFELISLTGAVFSNSWKAVLLIAAIFGLRFLFGKKISPAWRFSLWLGVAIPLIFHISLPFSWSVFQVIPSGSQLFDFSASAGELNSFDAKISAADSTSVQSSQLLPWLMLFSCLWFAGCVVMIVVFAKQIFACRKWVRQSRPVTCQRALEIFEDCRRRMKVKAWLHIAEGPDAMAPFLLGVIRPVLLLPEGMVQNASKNQLQTIFLHELAHLKRWDVWSSWLMSVLLAVHWFNPFLWLAVRRMNSDREEACDAMALEVLNPQERLEYGRALLDIAEQFLSHRKAPGLVGISETLEQMRGRITVIGQIGTWKWQWKLLAGGFFFLVSLAIITDPPSRELSRTCMARTCVESSCDPSCCLPCCSDDPCRAPTFCEPCEPCVPASCEDCCFPCEEYCGDEKK